MNRLGMSEFNSKYAGILLRKVELLRFPVEYSAGYLDVNILLVGVCSSGVCYDWVC